MADQPDGGECGGVRGRLGSRSPPQVIFVHGWAARSVTGTRRCGPLSPVPGAKKRSRSAATGRRHPTARAPGRRRGQLLEDRHSAATSARPPWGTAVPRTASTCTPQSSAREPEEAIAGLDASSAGGPAGPEGRADGALDGRPGHAPLRRGPDAGRQGEPRAHRGHALFSSPLALLPFHLYGVEYSRLSGLDAVITNEGRCSPAHGSTCRECSSSGRRPEVGGRLSKIEGRRPRPLGSAGVLNLINKRGGNPDGALERALRGWPAPSTRPHGLPRRSVGTGAPPIGAIRIDRRPRRSTRSRARGNRRARTCVKLVPGPTATAPRSTSSRPSGRRPTCAGAASTCGIPQHCRCPVTFRGPTVRDFLAGGEPNSRRTRTICSLSRRRAPPSRSSRWHNFSASSPTRSASVEHRGSAAALSARRGRPRPPA